MYARITYVLCMCTYVGPFIHTYNSVNTYKQLKQCMNVHTYVGMCTYHTNMTEFDGTYVCMYVSTYIRNVIRELQPVSTAREYIIKSI